jgi:hypothetical protein
MIILFYARQTFYSVYNISVIKELFHAYSFFILFFFYYSDEHV